MTVEAADCRVVLISGGSRGLGRELVEQLLGDGWRVATFSRSANEFVTDAIARHPDSFFWASVDLNDTAGVRTFAKQAIRHFGRVDLLINNAGVLRQGLFVTAPPVQIESIITCNLTSPLTLAHECARRMMVQGGGTIVNISSVNAVRGYRGVAVYSAAKAGLDGLTPSLAHELGPAGIRVNTVVPGFFDSDMTAGVTEEYRDRILRRTPIGRLGTVGDVAGAVRFLISPEADFITGQTLIIDGGITC